MKDSIIPIFTKFFDTNGIKYKYNKSDIRITAQNLFAGEIIFRSGDNQKK